MNAARDINNHLKSIYLLKSQVILKNRSKVVMPRLCPLSFFVFFVFFCLFCCMWMGGWKGLGWLSQVIRQSKSTFGANENSTIENQKRMSQGKIVLQLLPYHLFGLCLDCYVHCTDMVFGQLEYCILFLFPSSSVTGVTSQLFFSII